MHLRPAEKTGEFLTVNVKAKTEPVPAENSAEDLIEAWQIQVLARPGPESP